MQPFTYETWLHITSRRRVPIDFLIVLSDKFIVMDNTVVVEQNLKQTNRMKAC